MHVLTFCENVRFYLYIEFLWAVRSLQPHHLPQLFLRLPLFLVKGVGINVQRCTGLGVAQQAGYRSHIHSLGNQQAGVCMPQAVYVQIFRQPVLAQNLLESEGEAIGVLAGASGIIRVIPPSPRPAKVVSHG